MKEGNIQKEVWIKKKRKRYLQCLDTWVSTIPKVKSTYHFP